MKKIILFILSLSTLFVLPGCGGGGNGGEVPSIHWAKSFGGNSYEEAYSIQQTSDNGYIVVGRTFSFGAGDYDIWVMKLNSSGNITWQKTYGGTFGDFANSIQQTSDGGYIVAGFTWSFSSGNHDVWVLKLSSSGDVEWQKTYSGDDEEIAYSIKQTSDGGYIVVGFTWSFSAVGIDYWVLKLSSSGDVEWQKTYGGVDHDTAYSIQQTNDGGYIIAGNSRSFGGIFDLWAIKLDSNGTIIWQKTYKGIGYSDFPYYIQQTSDNGYIVVGITSSFGTGKHDVWVMKLSSSGNITWQKTYGGTLDDFAYSIQQTSDNEYIVAGYTESFGAGKKDFWVMKLSSSGNITWQKTYGGTLDDFAYSIQQTSDNEYIVAGYTESFGAGFHDFWVLRLKSDGTVSPTAPSYIGADSSATVQNTSVVPNDTSVTPVNSAATVTDTAVTSIDSNATVQTQASD